MAQAQTRNILGVVDKRRDHLANTNAASSTTVSNIRDVNAMRTRLAAISGTTYTAAVLDKMTVNDMIYAIRVSDEAASI